MKKTKIWKIANTDLNEDKVEDQLAIFLFPRVPSVSDGRINLNLECVFTDRSLTCMGIITG